MKCDLVDTKVLVISHNVFDRNSNMGKTLASFFHGWNCQCLAQLYLHSEIPTSEICHRYYRITDTDALKSVFSIKRQVIGRSFSVKDIDSDRSSSRVDTGVKRKIYTFGRKRTSLIYMARNTLWRLSGWYSQSLKDWISEFNPDVIFFASGDYAFVYNIAYKISLDFDIPMVMYCCDDYFINRKNPNSLLSIPVYKAFMKCVHRCMERTTGIITICDKMSDAYRKLFDKPIYTIYTGYSAKESADADEVGIVYLGNLGYSRNESLVDIGRALQRISERTGKKYHLDVYSAETRKETLRDLTQENGIIFHGSVGSEEVRRIIAKSKLVVHAESFDCENRKQVMYSVSTKIADLLASGKCIFAYGPSDVASIEYLKENRAACVVDDPRLLGDSLLDILENREKRMKYVDNAKELADKNHNSDMVQNKIREIMTQACR